MKLLLTSAGIRNPSIRAALDELLPKPLEECDALLVPTAGYGHPNAGPPRAWNFIAGREPECPMAELGWRSLGVLEVTALPSLGRDWWRTWVEETDVILANGGDAIYLAHWMRESGLAYLLPSLDAVWVGLSGGSLVMCPHIGGDFVRWPTDGADDEALGIVDFAIFPHLDHPDLPENTMADAEGWAAGMDVPCYAIDDETAIVWVDGAAEVVSEGNWKLFPPGLA
jgi:dipeptidase E